MRNAALPSPAVPGEEGRDRAGPPGLPPGSELPRSRQTARWVMRPLAFLEQLRERHGDVFTIHLANEEPWVVVSDPELIKQVFAAPADVLHAGEGNRVMQPIFGLDSVLLLDEARHLQQRRLLLPPLHGDRVRGYAEAIRGLVEAEVDAWPVGEDVPAWPRMQNVTLEAILRIVFGASGDPHRLAPLREAVKGLNIPTAPGEERSQAFRAALAHADALVLAEVEHRRAAGGRGDDVLALLLAARDEDGTPMTDREIRDNLITLLVSGHETTATSIAWALERLARTPQAMRRIEAEAPDGGGPYTEAAIRETLRMRPALPMVARLTKRPFQLGEHLIPEGVTINPSILLLHHRPDVYPRPHDFLPERFLDTPPGTYTWIPFGGGVRRCVGASFAMLEMRVILSTLLARASVRASEPEPEGMRSRAVTLVPARGARVTLRPR